MPLPLAPLLPLALRLGAVAATALAVKRAIAARTRVGRTDQRSEDALDDLGDGLAIHHPTDRADAATRQTNSAWRQKRVIRWGKHAIEIDAAFLGRLRIRRL